MENEDSDDSIVEVEISSESRQKIESLCTDVFGDAGGSLANLRLSWKVPPPDAGHEAERTGWRTYACDVIGHRFAVPHGAPIPVLAADHINSAGEQESILLRYVHPDLIDQPDVILDRLVYQLQEEVREHLASLSTTVNMLSALQDVDDLPFGSVPRPYQPTSSAERIGYEAAGKERPRQSE